MRSASGYGFTVENAGKKGFIERALAARTGPEGAAVARAVETVQPMLTQQKHELCIDLPATPLMLLGDMTRVTQVLGNVLGKAEAPP